MKTCLLITPDLDKSSWCKKLLTENKISVINCTNFPDLHEMITKKFTFVIFIGEELPDSRVTKNMRENIKQGQIVELLEINGYREGDSVKLGNLLRLYLENPKAEKVLSFISQERFKKEPMVHLWPEITNDYSYEDFSMVC
jgi:hypothetical protein